MIYTSYFANLKNIVNPIAICGKSPDWYKGPQFRKLAPKWWFFDKWKRGEFTNDDYIKYYKEEVLDQYLPFAIEQQLQNIWDSGTYTLICYEKPGDFCHRHLVADWLNSNGFFVKEWDNVK